MTLTQLQVFLAVVEAGGFTAAAEACHMTQSAVSHAIAGLERELGVALLERTRAGAALTEAGVRVVPHARRVLDHTERIRQEAAAAVGLTAGKLRVGSLPSVATRLLPGIIGAFQRRYPGIDLTLLEGTDQEVHAWIAGGVVDVGVVTLPTADVDAVPLAADDMRAVVPAAHPLAARPTVRPGQLAADPFVLSKGGCEPLIRSIFRAAGASPRVHYEAGDMGAVLALVREGLGVTIVPALALPSSPEGVRVLPLDPPVRRRLALATRASAGASPATAAFIQHARAMALTKDRADVDAIISP